MRKKTTNDGLLAYQTKKTNKRTYLKKVISCEEIRVDIIYCVSRGSALGDVQETAFSDVVPIFETGIGDAAVGGSDLHFTMLDNEHVLAHLCKMV